MLHTVARINLNKLENKKPRAETTARAAEDVYFTRACERKQEAMKATKKNKEIRKKNRATGPSTPNGSFRFPRSSFKLIRSTLGSPEEEEASPPRNGNLAIGCNYPDGGRRRLAKTGAARVLKTRAVFIYTRSLRQLP